MKRLFLATGVALALTAPIAVGGVEAAPSTSSSTTITVREGDSLAGLAWRHKVDLSALLRANSLAITSIIHPGDTLVLPAGAIPSASSPSPAASGGAATTGQKTYVVRPGDALAGIAWRHGVTLGALVAANGLSVSSVIHPGRSLTIPPATRSLPTAAPGTVATTGTTTSATPSTRPTSAPSPTSRSIDTLTTFLRAQVGLPYQFFSAGPRSYDCSGLVVAAFRQVGVALPHQSRALALRGTAVDWTTEPITAGDLVFTSAFDDPDRITHVGIALDGRRWIQAIGPGRDVSIGSLPAEGRIMEVRRISLP